jgi:hypothetical protein
MIVFNPPLSIDEWQRKAKIHEALITPITDFFLKQRGNGIKNPVHDFLFTYYNFSPAKLKQWIPAFDVELEMTEDLRVKNPWFNDQWFFFNGNLLSLNKTRIQTSTFKAATFIEKLMENILQQEPRFSCFGLHEWAMVYKCTPDAIRHQGYKLRVTPENLAKFVESQRICCSHYDAYRFFTEEARPLNLLNPVLETRLEMEQAGCLHVNMDLYKWATRLWPWIGSDFIAKAFLLAKKGRELDMRASPYDLSDEGFLPICIETEKGRQEYVKLQKQYTAESIPLREELLGFCKKLAGLPV